MAEALKLTAQPREQAGTRIARRLRDKGLTPAVVYGHKEATVSVSVSHEELMKAVRHGARIIDLQYGGKGETALIRAVQWDPMGHDILHVDFARVAADEKVTIEVPLVLRGTAPGIAAGGVLNQPLHAVTIECLVTNIPESIRVLIGELQLEQAIHVRELTLPEGVVVMDDPDLVVVQVVPKVEETEAAAGAAAQAEPELIGRKEKEGEEE